MLTNGHCATEQEQVSGKLGSNFFCSRFIFICGLKEFNHELASFMHNANRLLLGYSCASQLRILKPVYANAQFSLSHGNLHHSDCNRRQSSTRFSSSDNRHCCCRLCLHVQLASLILTCIKVYRFSTITARLSV